MDPTETIEDTVELTLPLRFAKMLFAATAAFAAGEAARKAFDKAVEIRRNKA